MAMALGNKISIHAPAKGATIHTATQSAVTWEFQSTLPRRERPHHIRPASTAGISIHAPAKGATSQSTQIR